MTIRATADRLPTRAGLRSAKLGWETPCEFRVCGGRRPPHSEIRMHVRTWGASCLAEVVRVRSDPGRRVVRPG